jgi:hypothetical protein
MKLLKSAFPFMILTAADCSIVLGTVRQRLHTDQQHDGGPNLADRHAVQQWQSSASRRDLRLGVTLTAKHGTVRPLNWRFQRCQRYDCSPVDAHATLLSNGNVLIAGGFYLDSAEVYNRNRSVQGDGSDAYSRSGHAATLLRNGKVLIAGGMPGNDGDVLASAELYDPATGVFAATGNMSRARIL